MSKLFMRALVVLLLVLACTPSASAQSLLSGKTEETVTEPPTDVFGRLTPRGTLRGFLRAVSEQDYVRAANYLDLSKLPKEEAAKGPELAEKLKNLLERKGLIPPDGAISNEHEGNLEDNLAPDFENIATIRTNNAPVPMNVQRVTVNDQGTWLISAAFVSQINLLSQSMSPTLLDGIIGDRFADITFKGSPATHWVTMVLLYVFTYFAAGFLARGLIAGLRIASRLHEKDKTRLMRPTSLTAFEKPAQLFLTSAGVIFLAVILGVSSIVRHAFMPVSLTFAFAGIGLFIWSCANAIITGVERRMASRNLHNVSSLLMFTRRSVKFVLIVATVIITLNALGVDVTAGLAALGIGGIALALGAQKTLENFIGSLSIVADQPFYIGDFCKIGDTSGIIEDIGMRSTRIRTNDKTLVTIPNGDLSTQRIENLARRNRFLLNRKLVLAYGASSAALRDFVFQANLVINAQDNIIKEGTPIRMLGFAETGYIVEVWCYVETTSYDEFLKVQADITYDLTDAAAKAGVHFAAPAPPTQGPAYLAPPTASEADQAPRSPQDNKAAA